MSYLTEELFGNVETFLAEHLTEYESVEEAVAAYIEQHNGQIKEKHQGQTGFMELSDLLEELTYERDETRRLQLAQQILERDTDNIDAKIAQLEVESVSQFELLSQLKEFESVEHKKWVKGERSGWMNFKERPYMRLKNRLAFQYLNQKMYPQALKHFEELYRMNPSDNLGSRYMMMVLYCLLYQWEKAVKFANQKEHKNDAEMIGKLLVLAIVTERSLEAQKLFKKMTDLDGEFLAALDFSSGIESARSMFSLSKEGYFEIPSLSLFDGIEDFLFGTEIVFDWLRKHYEDDYQEEFELHTERNPLFAGLPSGAVEALLEEGLIRPEDFQSWRKQDLLALRGIGKVSVERLVANGIRLKEG
ncbi:tetratricopeptide repeat protein [Streptococcus sp. ZJ93]|uniref:tetratricopeptide repeat protein n=1 Tax=Streptococcus handemini TaxID=3161188 RepID=UPI0034D71EF7